MKQVNIHEAKTHLSRLVDAATRGEPFVIARAGTPLVEVRAVRPEGTADRIGFLAGQTGTSADIGAVGAAEIAEMFGAGDAGR